MWIQITLSMLAFSTGIWTISLCPIGWFETEGVCFKMHEYSKTWFAAEVECRNEGGYLATINTTGRHNAIQNLLHMFGNNNYHWIGATDFFMEGHYRWISNGEDLGAGYQNWYPGHPYKNNKSNCVYLYYNHPYQFIVANCNSTIFSICERS